MTDRSVPYDARSVEVVKSAGSAFIRAGGHDCDPLRVIEGILEHIAQLELELDREALHAREHGVSWDALGTALGISRQAAAKRYAMLEVEQEWLSRRHR